jgi:hypothetical protein
MGIPFEDMSFIVRGAIEELRDFAYSSSEFAIPPQDH